MAGSLPFSPPKLLTMYRYFCFYHPLFPIILPPSSADVVYTTSPLLFWTLVITAARHDSQDFALLQTLVPIVKKLLWFTIADPPHTLSSLQAMAIFCVWPFPSPSMPIDLTFILAGILKSAAMHAGLHRPDILTHYSRAQYSFTEDILREAARVWCCTYMAVERCVHMTYLILILSGHFTSMRVH